MKIITVVGVRKSGKTTVVTHLITELKSRGYRVGSVKNIGCPGFSIDKPGSNSDLHRKAGADFVCLKGKREMSIIFDPMDENELYASFPVDYLILEGEYELRVPRIICAHNAEEIEERITEEAFAVSGRMGAELSSYGELPAFNILEETERLADYIEAHVGHVHFPLERCAKPVSVKLYCQGKCDKHRHK